MIFPLWSLTNWSHTVSKVTRGGKIITGCVSDLVYVQCRVYLPRPSPQWAERSSGSPPRPWGLRSVWSCVESTSGLQKRRVAQNAVCFFFLSWAGRSFTYSSKTQKEALTGCLWICSPRVFAKFTSGVSVLMVTSGSFAVGSRETEVSVVDFFVESRKNSLTESGCMHYGTIMYYQAGNEYWSIIGKKTQYIATKTNNCRVFISVSVRVIAVTSHTVLQGSQQGNGTSVQQVPVVVETHQVAVEHPAELQPEPAESGPTMGTAIQRDQWTSASPHLPFLFRCTGPPFVSLQSCNTNMNITQLTHSRCCCEMETMYIKVSRTFRLHRPQTGWRPAPARLVVPAESERNTEEAGPRWALNRDGESTAVSLCLSIKLLHHHKAASLTQHLYI